MSINEGPKQAGGETSRRKQLIIFDFDWRVSSLIDQDTDRYLFEVLDPELRKLLIQRKQSMQWTDNVADCLKKLNEKGFKRSQIEHAFSSLPLHPAMKRAIEELYDTNIESDQHKKSQNDNNQIETIFLILSNSNSKFIEIVLTHHKMNFRNIFKEIITNPADWSENDGYLDLDRRIKESSDRQHQCQFDCSPNMCKGEEFISFLDRNGGRDSFERVTYIGDGENDYCPIVRLKKSDFALVRKRRGLIERIKEEDILNNNEPRLRCKVVEWDGAWEVEQFFRSNLYN
ncbi:phosphatase phospho-type [Phakopsora pachyrhizi]|uniref:Phosphatase phospho-type n=1 Tax=Phakopsora pachyrhizi TaxID=170000 RepID=A0AAV0BI41_PHAPC|nr:phosphatase phospho-type [Phakopsora pachyrhizi]CAH7686226.1 phosphatase phospho-type [Phakopsora pachyrhizi]